VDVDDPHRLGCVVAKAVLDAGRDEHERSGRRRDLLAVAEEEGHLALEDGEGVVLVGVDVGLEDAAGDDLDDAEGEPGRVRGAGEELHVAHSAAMPGRDDDGGELRHASNSGAWSTKIR
jgi:hypothetical protein